MEKEKKRDILLPVHSQDLLGLFGAELTKVLLRLDLGKVDYALWRYHKSEHNLIDPPRAKDIIWISLRGQYILRFIYTYHEWEIESSPFIPISTFSFLLPFDISIFSFWFNIPPPSGLLEYFKIMLQRSKSFKRQLRKLRTPVSGYFGLVVLASSS